jgi:hypothetical protein
LDNVSTEFDDDGTDERNERLSSAQLQTFHKHSKIKNNKTNMKRQIFSNERLPRFCKPRG